MPGAGKLAIQVRCHAFDAAAMAFEKMTDGENFHGRRKITARSAS